MKGKIKFFCYQGLHTSPPAAAACLSEATESQSTESDPAGDSDPRDEEEPGETERRISRRGQDSLYGTKRNSEAE